ncbi:sortase domain-bontaining protein [Arthrobacter sp. NPDC097144]|uniref:sortase domain-containing protein n=1 Tax=Arthrobacter sp. NPDC097144 TaxID=3363946 RepID=UPI00381B2912
MPSPRQTTDTSSTADNSNAAEATGTSAPPQTLNAETAALPRTLELPSIGAGSDLMQVGLRADGVLEVPPGNPGAPAAWYTGSPRPGAAGPAVLLGHVNAEDGGPGVFAGLRELKPGDEVRIQREDGSAVVFIVVFGEPYPKDAFPTEKVYGNTEGPELRLITCDGYDAKTGTFEDNYVVYASLAR